MLDIDLGAFLFYLALVFFGFAAMCGIEQAIRAFKAWRAK